MHGRAPSTRNGQQVTVHADGAVDLRTSTTIPFCNQDPAQPPPATDIGNHMILENGDSQVPYCLSQSPGTIDTTVDYCDHLATGLVQVNGGLIG